MQIRTFTNFWTIEKKLYSISDYQLPVAVPLRVLGVFLLVGIPWCLIMWLIHLPFTANTYLIWLAPPAALTYFGSRPVLQGKTLFQYLKSRIVFLLEQKHYKGLTPDYEYLNKDYEIETIIFTRKPLPKQADNLEV